MDTIRFRKILADSLSIVNIGIQMEYFSKEDEEYLNSLLLQLFKKGIAEDITGTAIYGIYSPDEKKLYFNAKVFKDEAEALTYILHEIKHGLDHFNNNIGFQNNDNDEFVGMNEGATQRFATDLAEKILNITFPKKNQSSLGIMIETNLDEYQIEDKINQLFCKVMNISMAQFLKMQNAKDKTDFNKLIAKFNQFADFNTFRKCLDGIYKIQEETWFDSNGQLLEKESKPTPEQTQRAIYLINKCQNEIMKYAKNNNLEATIKEELIMPINEYGEIIQQTGDNIVSQEREIQDNEIINEYDYINYHQNIINQLKDRNILDSNTVTIFVTEFRYEQDKLPKVVFYRTDSEYKKVTIPLLDNGNLDLEHYSKSSVSDINEIVSSIDDCETEFGVIANGPEYSKLLEASGKKKEAINVLKRWATYLDRQNEIELLRQKQEQSAIESRDIMANLRELAYINDSDLNFESDNDDTFNDTTSIQYGSIIIGENGITTIQQDGSIHGVQPEEEADYISKVEAGLMISSTKLNEKQKILLDSYKKKINDQHKL